VRDKEAWDLLFGKKDSGSLYWIDPGEGGIEYRQFEAVRRNIERRLLSVLEDLKHMAAVNSPLFRHVVSGRIAGAMGGIIHKVVSQGPRLGKEELEPEVKAWLASEEARMVAEEEARRTEAGRLQAARQGQQVGP